MGLFKVSAPPPRQFGNEIGQILGQYGAANAAQFENAAQWNPRFQQLGLDMYSQAVPSINNVLNQANSATRASTMSDLANYGGQGVDAIRGMNPGQTSIYDTLVSRAQSQLAAGNRLTPNQTYSAANSVRSDWANRGFDRNTLPAQLDEAVALSRTGDNVEQQRQQFAAGVANMGNEFYTRPAMGSVLGSGSDAGNVMGQFNAGTPDTFNSLMGYGSDLFNTNYNADAAARIATGNNRINAINGMTSAMTSY
jgi:hypothetical protein